MNPLKDGIQKSSWLFHSKCHQKGWDVRVLHPVWWCTANFPTGHKDRQTGFVSLPSSMTSNSSSTVISSRSSLDLLMDSILRASTKGSSATNVTSVTESLSSSSLSTLSELEILCHRPQKNSTTESITPGHSPPPPPPPSHVGKSTSLRVYMHTILKVGIAIEAYIHQINF